MARFYATVTNGRGNTTAVGGRSSVDSAHIRGWDAGVRVECVKLPDGDAFDVFMTTGSHASSRDVYLGRVTLLQGFDKPVFVPEA